MDREIKFRAWDKESEKMRDLDSVAFHGHGCFDTPTGEVKVINLWGKNIINDSDIILHREAYEAELMQYTGLKDKNGKEIFEGDIAKIEMTGDYHIIAKVEWVDGCFCWVANQFCVTIKQIVFNLRNSNVEVIGNVFEDGDLLNE